MTWTPEALSMVRSLQTNCLDFIYEASEFIAVDRGLEAIGVAEVQCVLGFMKANTIGTLAEQQKKG